MIADLLERRLWSEERRDYDFAGDRFRRQERKSEPCQNNWTLAVVAQEVTSDAA
jgi:hypothetical protein